MSHPGRRFLAGLLVPIGFVAACDAAGHAERGTNSERTFLPVSDAEAWEHVPRATPPLPSWARTTIASLPASTLLQLDLDALQRAENPLGKELSGRLRWTVADANRCAYAKESAEADLVDAGLDAEALRQLADVDRLAEPERLAVVFARKLTLSAASITDDDVAALVAAFGPDDVVAIVHTVAYANFQDRLYLGVGLTSEPGGPTPPRRTRAAPDAVFAVPERPVPTAASASRAVGSVVPPNWNARTFDELQKALEQQKTRTPRVPEPDAARLARFPRPKRGRIDKTAWGRFSRSYQPLLAGAWLDATRTFGREAKLDEVLDNSIFWVITRTSDCFY